MSKLIVSLLVVVISLAIFSWQTEPELTLFKPNYIDENGLKQGVYFHSHWNIGDCTNEIITSYFWVKNDTSQFYIQEVNDQNACYNVLASYSFHFNRILNDSLMLQLDCYSSKNFSRYLQPDTLPENHEFSYNSNIELDQTIFEFMLENKKYGNSISPFYFRNKIIAGSYTIYDKKNWKILDTLTFN